MNDYFHTFTYTSKTGAVKNIEFHVSGDAGLNEMLEAFTQYLKAVGYFVEPSAVLDFVEEDNHFSAD
jgi:hypothetical protein